MNSVIALGTFDGVHLGHQRLIQRCLELACANGLRPLIYTFSNHPLEAFSRQPQLLMSYRARIAALSSLCETVTVPFDREYAAMEPKAFPEMLQAKFAMDTAVAGFNYTFGDKGRGDMAYLKTLGKKLGFQVVEIPPCLYDGTAISSTRIRAEVSQGRVEAAAAMLGRPYTLSGVVVLGRAIGHGLGFPTANLRLEQENLVLPASGVYAAWATLQDGSRHGAVTNVGSNPTVGGVNITVETHVLDMEANLYGQGMEVAFIQRLRGDVHFPSREALSAQIARDVAAAREILYSK